MIIKYNSDHSGEVRPIDLAIRKTWHPINYRMLDDRE